MVTQAVQVVFGYSRRGFAWQSERPIL